jgi:hypothetical protein
LRVPPTNPADDECVKVPDRLALGKEEEVKGARTDGILANSLRCDEGKIHVHLAICRFKMCVRVDRDLDSRKNKEQCIKPQSVSQSSGHGGHITPPSLAVTVSCSDLLLGS